MSGADIRKTVEAANERLGDMIETIKAVKGERYGAAVVALTTMVQVCSVAAMNAGHLRQHCQSFDPDAFTDEMARASAIVTRQLAGLLDLKPADEEQLREDAMRCAQVGLVKVKLQ